MSGPAERSFWTLGGAVAGAFFGYATSYNSDPYWVTLTYISTTATLGAVAGLGLGLEREWGRDARRREPEVPRCLHTRREPVHTLGGEVVAQLCLSCDDELAADYKPSLTELFYDPSLTGRSER